MLVLGLGLSLVYVRLGHGKLRLGIRFIVRMLTGCYDNARHFRKCLGIYGIAQGFREMPRHFQKCLIYDITASKYATFSGFKGHF
jgi:hypothetical protein